METFIRKKLIVESIYNRFWKDMVNSVIRLTNKLKIRNITYLHLMPLWYNSELNFDFRQRWNIKATWL